MKKFFEKKISKKEKDIYKSIIKNCFSHFGPFGSKIIVEIKEKSEPTIEASIDLKTWTVKFELPDGLSLEKTLKTEEFLKKYNVDNWTYTLLKDIAAHEIGHWEFPRGYGFGCPYDIDIYYSKFIVPIKEEVLNSKRFSSEFSETVAFRIANAVTDIINNANIVFNYSQNQENFVGQALFWYLEGQKIGKYTKEYTLFVKINLENFKNNDMNEVLAEFMNNSIEIDNKVKKLSTIFTFQNMFKIQKWEKLAREYAKEVIPLIDPAEEFCLAYSCSTGIDKGKKNDKDKIEKIIFYGDKKAIEEIKKEEDKYTIFDTYYSALARKIKIETSTGNLSKMKMNIPTIYREYEEDRDSIEDIAKYKIKVNVLEKKVNLVVPWLYYQLNIEIKEERKKIPGDLVFIIDSSGSMVEPKGKNNIVPWGDESSYHYALLAFYGAIKFLKTEQLLSKINIYGISFSDKTIVAEGLKDIKKMLFKPMSNGTEIDIGVVSKVLEKLKNAVVCFISDGEINNWNTIKDRYIALLKNKQSVMLQIGMETETAKDMKKAFLPVIKINDAKDLVGIIIDLTKKRYEL